MPKFLEDADAGFQAPITHMNKERVVFPFCVDVSGSMGTPIGLNAMATYVDFFIGLDARYDTTATVDLGAFYDEFYATLNETKPEVIFKIDISDMEPAYPTPEGWNVITELLRKS